MQHNLAIASGRQEEDIENELENHAVDCVDQFYFGSVISAADESFWKKSLHQHSKEGVLYISFGQSDLTLA